MHERCAKVCDRESTVLFGIREQLFEIVNDLIFSFEILYR